MQTNLKEKLDQIKVEFEQIQDELNNPDVLADIDLYKKLNKKRSKLEPVFKVYINYLTASKNIEDSLKILKEETDEDFLNLAKEELNEAKKNMQIFEEELKELMVEKDPNDEKDCYIEIKGAAGGDEANIFAGDLYRMYSRFASKMDWELEIIDYEETDRGGYSFIAFEIKGLNSYQHLKFESGVHRVQRVPQTESQGRVHTSTATILVTPLSEEDEVDVNIPTNEIRIDTYRASGSGGQHINKTDSAVRITHIPTGIVVASQQGRSQHDNKDKAMRMLVAKIKEKTYMEKQSEINQKKKTLVGTGDRSEKIRTYNYPQNRITDHRIGLTLKKLDRIMAGGLEQIIEVLLVNERELN